MMAAVHRRRAHAEGALEERSGRDAHRMLARLVAVRHGAGPLAIQILIQGAAERDVEDLNATTDRENRQGAPAARSAANIVGTARGTRPAVSSARTYAVFSVTRSRPSTMRCGAVTATG